jgi:aspartyl-tRNA(Asn)/glutamyl-tRNA(Gln) amidotransferase subunit A
VARAGGFPQILHDFEVVGPIARTTEDAALLFVMLAGPDERDPASLRWPSPSPLQHAAPDRLRVLYVPTFGGAPVDPEIATSVADAARALETLGHAVEQGAAPFDTAALDDVWSVVGPAGLAWLLRDRPNWREVIGAPLRETAERGLALTAADYVRAMTRTAELRARFSGFFVDFDAILTPSAAALPWPADVTHPPTIAGQPVGPRGHAIFTAFANAAGLPGISLPCRPASSGLPIGFQLVGAPGTDERLLAVAHAYEEVCPWADRWPAL